ncbi:hypothetical protein D9757_005490 [Collybiopsis confluens]|uniref:Uncharacterized protein n=1 Tax=Collybiopsis confluens TaxID=2823264 RepID=A0A8H5HLS6_9AGAR|nr:hypothetical protein D9757_005490 [Collybiopsis confluens]
MKFSYLFFLHFCLAALSQTITILSPPAGSELLPGQDVTVQLAFPNSLTGMQHISAVIGIINCAGAPCPTDATSTLGIPVFSGNYTPQFHETNLPPYQNFSVTAPSTLAAGTNMITAAQFMLVGASASPVLQFTNVTVNTPSKSNRRAAMVRGRVVYI